MLIRLFVAMTMLMSWASLSVASMEMIDRDGALTVSEGGRSVLTYRYLPVDPPEGVEERYRRSCYIHPLYGLDGDILTEDYPSDHYHHRGIFWAWPKSTVGEDPLDLWLIQGREGPGARQHFEKWLAKETTETTARFVVQNVWKIDSNPNPIVRETVSVTVHSSTSDTQLLDFQLDFKNVSTEKVKLLGAGGKGYGGFSLRPNAKRKPLLYTTVEGEREEDALECETPWVDVSSRPNFDAPYSGVAIFQHPSNPGFPHPGWIIRHYGLLGAAWPHLESHFIEPEENLTLRYRLCVHRGTATEVGIGRIFDRFVAEVE